MLECDIHRSILHRFRHVSAKYSGLLFSEHFLVCYRPIPKNANSYLKAVLLLNDPATTDFDPTKTTALKYLKMNPKALRLPSYNALVSSRAVKLLVLRDPASRLVSCFANKIFDAGAQAERVTAMRALVGRMNQRLGATLVEPEEISFSSFLQYISITPDWRRDPHCRTQCSFLRSGLDYNLIGTTDNLSSVTERLEGLGMSTDLPRAATKGVTKASSYIWNDVNFGGEVEDLPVRVMREMGGVPSFKTFFRNDKIREIFFRTYEADIKYYCSASGKSVQDYQEDLAT